MRQIEDLNNEKDHLHNIINGLTTYIIVLDDNGLITDMNQTMRSELHNEHQDYIGLPFWQADFLTTLSTQQEKLQKVLNEVKQKRQPIRFDAALYLNQSHVDVDMTFSSLSTDLSKPSHVIISAINISDRLMFERQLLLSEANFKQVISQTSDGLIVFKENGMVEWSNEKGLRMFNKSEHELRQLNLFNVLSDKDKEEFLQHLNSLINEKKEHTDPFTIKINNGNFQLPIEITLTDYDNSKAALFLATISDLSELLKSNEQLESLLNEKSALLNEVHHRVKNNLQVLNSLLHLQQQHVDQRLAGERIRILSFALCVPAIMPSTFE
ncbi:MAG: PAS domain S-box protein [Gammaproteobacteria bacterium]|nr:PAS domain S-box protein [Gammaproteobacteria bacterium]